MTAGLDKYYQIARCFGDEDLTADRQPEFTQLDVEFSFATREQVYRLIEGLLVRIFRLVGAVLQAPFERLTYTEAMRRFGSDKPDLRFGMELQDLAPALAGTTFAPFASALEAGGDVKGLAAKAARSGRAKRWARCRRLASGIARGGSRGSRWAAGWVPL